MSRAVRTVFFWIHLVTGLVVGLVVAVMSITGVSIAFESQIVDWADRDARTVQVPAPDAARLTIDEMLARVREARPEAQPSGVTVLPEADAAVVVATGRDSAVYVNPYTGEVKAQGARGWRSFFHTMEELHRWLAAQGDFRQVGKAVTGVSNAAFLFLALSGLYLWWPRKWTLRSMRPTLWFRRGLQGKARDFNWHNVIGFWSLPVLIVLTSSGMVISYKWASDLIFKLTGDAPPVAQGPVATPPVAVPTPQPGAQRQSLDALFAEAKKQVPAWERITLRMGNPPRGDGQQQRGPRADGAPREGGGRGGQDGAPREGGGRGGQDGAPREGGGRGGPGGGGPQASTFVVRERGGWPLFASAQVSLDPFTAQVLRTETYADFSKGRKVRTWMRFLHTGEALGWMGQLIAAIASLGGAFLVYTGFALSWRRFFPSRRRVEAPMTAPATVTPSETNVA